ncbi:hypothetical protein D3C87_1811320 [compost metagenome]
MAQHSLRVTREPYQRFAVQEVAELITESTFREHDVQLAIILHLVKHAAQRHRQLQIDQGIQADEFFQNGGEPAGDEILGNAEP